MATFTNLKGERVKTTKNTDGSINRQVLSTGNPVTATHTGSKDKITGVNTVDSYNQTVAPIKIGSPVVSSKDRTGEYNKLSGDIATRETDPADIPDTGLDTGTGTGAGKGTGAGGSTTTTTSSKETGDPVYDSYLTNRSMETAKAEKWAEEQTKEVERLLPQTLASIDATYKSSKTNIESTYSRLIDSQKKIAEVDLGRVKAYGVQNGGQYTPLEFTRAVSKSEAENAREIGRLEGERNSLIAAAKAARQEGRVGAMRTSVEDLQKVEKQMREKVDFLMKEVQTRYEITEKAREKKETERLLAVEKSLKQAAFKYLDEFETAKDPDAIDKIIKGIIKDSGGLLTENDYMDIYNSMSTAKSDKLESANKTKKDELDIKNKEEDILTKQTSRYNQTRNTDSLISDRANGNDDEANIFKDINEALSLTNEDGNPVVGEDGFVNPKFFQELLSAAKEDGISRADFIAEYGHLINSADDRIDDYKLTQEEKDKLQNI